MDINDPDFFKYVDPDFVFEEESVSEEAIEDVFTSTTTTQERSSDIIGGFNDGAKESVYYSPFLEWVNDVNKGRKTIHDPPDSKVSKHVVVDSDIADIILGNK